MSVHNGRSLNSFDILETSKFSIFKLHKFNFHSFMEDEGGEFKIPTAKIFLVFVSLVLKVYCHLSGVLSQQGELVIMNSLGVINSVRDWLTFNWQYQVDEITKLPLSREHSNSNYEECVKTVLMWVVMTRMIIAHLYIVTYIANFYPILTFCRGKLLVPWLAMSAVKNFVLEFIVLVVVVLLYLQNHLSIYLLCEFFIHKLVTLAPAVYNWLTMSSFYTELNTINRRKLARLNTSIVHRKSSVVYHHPNIIIGLPMSAAKSDYPPELFHLPSRPGKCVTSLTTIHHSLLDLPRNLRLAKSLSWTWLDKREIDSLVVQNKQSHAGQLESAISEASTSSACGCSIHDDQEYLDVGNKTSEETVFTDQYSETIDPTQSSFLPHDWFLKKMNDRFKLSDYTNLLNQYNDTGSSKWSSEEDISEDFSNVTMKPVPPEAPKSSKPLVKIDSSQWRRRLEIIGSSFESTLQYYNQSYDSQSSKLSINDLGLSRSWILDGMIITGTVTNNITSNQSPSMNMRRLERVEIEALKAYNKKTLWEDRLNRQRLKDNQESVPSRSDELSKREKCERTNEVTICPESSKSLSVKGAIAKLDWSLGDFSSHSSDHCSLMPEEIADEDDNEPLVATLASDNTSNTMELLAFAFGFSDRSEIDERRRTAEIYSSAEEIPNVFYEIIKTARLRTIKHDCNCRSTADVDYGDNYWKTVKYIM